MDPDYVAFYLPSFYSPLPTTRSTAALLLFSRRAHERSLYRFQKTLRRILISRQLSRARERASPTIVAAVVLAVIRRQASKT